MWNHRAVGESWISNGFSSVQSLPWTASRQASLSITNSWSSPKPTSIKSVILSNHLILCQPLLLLPSIFPSIRVFSSESALCIRWPKDWSFSFNISPSNEIQDWSPLGWTGWISLQSKELSRVFFSITVRCWTHHMCSSSLSLFYAKTLATWLEEPTHWIRPWCWERLWAGGQGDDRGWNGWMASPTQWILVWSNSGRWWRTRKPSVLQPMGSQRVGHNLETEQQQSLLPKISGLDSFIPGFLSIVVINL